MKKKYLSPEMDVEKFTMECSVMTASDPVGGGEIPGGDIDALSSEF